MKTPEPHSPSARPYDLEQPVLPPMTLCGGLQAPYRVTRAQPDLASEPTLSEFSQSPMSKE